MGTSNGALPRTWQTIMTTDLALEEASRQSIYYRHIQTVADEQRQTLNRAILSARDAGASLGQIAKAVGVSRQRIHQIVGASR